MSDPLRRSYVIRDVSVEGVRSVGGGGVGDARETDGHQTDFYLHVAVTKQCQRLGTRVSQAGSVG